MRILLYTLTIGVASVAMAEAQPFERYQTIIDRKPFGPEPVNFDADATPGSPEALAAAAAAAAAAGPQRTAEEQQLASTVRVSMINVTPSGAVAIGFTDTSANPQENYYLKVGETSNGWVVKSAEPAEESVTLEKNGVEITVKLGETGGGKGGGAAAQKQGRVPPLGMKNLTPMSSAPSPEQKPNVITNLRERRRANDARAKEEAAKKAEAERIAREEREEREAARAAAEAEEKRKAEEERAQQREQLLAIQEQLKKAREEREAERAAKESAGEDANQDEN